MAVVRVVHLSLKINVSFKLIGNVLATYHSLSQVPSLAMKLHDLFFYSSVKGEYKVVAEIIPHVISTHSFSPVLCLVTPLVSSSMASCNSSIICLSSFTICSSFFSS